MTSSFTEKQSSYIATAAKAASMSGPSRPFRRPPLSALTPTNPGESLISSLSDLIKYNGRYNGNQLFCIQAEAINHRGSTSYGATEFTFRDLEKAVDNCAEWILDKIGIPGVNGTKHLPIQNPVALYMESDVGLFLHIAALLELGIPVLLLSVRLGVDAVRHLLRATESVTVLVSSRTCSILQDKVEDVSQVRIAESFSNLAKMTLHLQSTRTRSLQSNPGLILHSSGTTGFPKPIAVSGTYPLRYAACHSLRAEEVLDWANVSTLPLYHGFGFLAPCLSLSIGMTCIFPPSSVIPAAHSTLGLIKTFGAKSLMTVPSVVEDVLGLPADERQAGLETLAELEFLAVGGGALNPVHGASLAAGNVKFLNHYGVTEMGPIAPIFRPTVDYDWKYLRLRKDLGLELQPVESTPNWQLSGPAASGDGLFVIQDELELRPDSAPGNVEVRILGRKDDVIVLSTGEKVLPRLLEEELNKHPGVKTAIAVGNGYFEIAVLIEPVNPADSHSSLIESIWRRVQQVNKTLDAHARVSSKYAIIVKPKDKTIPRSDKGSVLRKSVHEIFKTEIDAAFVAMESDASEGYVDLSTFKQYPEQSVQNMVASIASDRIDMSSIRMDDDLFECGMDSLQATRLVRLINALARQSTSEPLKVRFIYQNPTMAQLVDALQEHDSGQRQKPSPFIRSRSSQISALANEMCGGIASNMPKHTVLLTGSTGSLGANALSQLVKASSVSKIICFCRGSETAFRKRQHSILSSMGLSLTSSEWAKVEVLAGLEHLQKPTEREEEEEKQNRIMEQLAPRVTHILHLAWPMDFQRLLESFRPHLLLVHNLIRIAELSHKLKASRRVRLVFASSIAVVRYASAPNQRPGTAVPEETMTDPLCTVPMGYAEAKWVCERMLACARDELGHLIEPVIVRIGQISGPEATQGLWKAEEHMPTLLKASQRIGALPKLNGTISWLPVDRAALCLTEMLLASNAVPLVLHLENPHRQPMKEVFEIWSHHLKLPLNGAIPFSDWLERAKRLDILASLQDFFTHQFRDLALGNVNLDTTQAQKVSRTLRETGLVSRVTLETYVTRWLEQGVLLKQE